MSGKEELVDRHYGFGGIMETIEAGLKAAGKNIEALTVDDLSPVDAFHTRGRDSTVELAELAELQPSDLVLDVGFGLGGTARHLAEQYGCKVAGIDLTEEYVAAGQKLTRLVGLDHMVDLRQGSALDIPFEDDRFDVAWTEHVQMNIPDKERFYSEMTRVLKPGGRLLFHDIFRGPGDSPFYPVPWAEDESISSLVPEAEARTAMQKAGLKIVNWIGKDDESLEFFREVSARIEAGGPPPMGIHLLMGETAQDKLNNYVLNLRGNRVSVALGMAVKT